MYIEFCTKNLACLIYRCNVIFLVHFYGLSLFLSDFFLFLIETLIGVSCLKGNSFTKTTLRVVSGVLPAMFFFSSLSPSMILATWFLEIDFFIFSYFYCFAVNICVWETLYGLLLGKLRDLPHSKNDFWTRLMNFNWRSMVCILSFNPHLFIFLPLNLTEDVT